MKVTTDDGKLFRLTGEDDADQALLDAMDFHRQVHIHDMVRGAPLSAGAQFTPRENTGVELLVDAPDNSTLQALAQRVARLNPNAGEIGAGMLASLVQDAKRALAGAEIKTPWHAQYLIRRVHYLAGEVLLEVVPNVEGDEVPQALESGMHVRLVEAVQRTDQPQEGGAA